MLKQPVGDYFHSALVQQAWGFVVQSWPEATAHYDVPVTSTTSRSSGLQELDGSFLWTMGSGVVILHPFLLPLFTELGLVEGKRFTGEEAQQKAVLVLHYLVTGAEAAEEYQLVLQKLLCGLSLESVVRAAVPLTYHEKEECENVLQAVTSHWKPLNHTSVEGLRTSFLQREGQLAPSETGWRLYIEKKTVDVLLDRMPWGISMIKLPWMEGILSVDWG
jgi:hypothetical protein